MAFVREEDITVYHRTEGAFNIDTGEYGSDTEMSETYSGNIQPISGKTLERLPEGTRTRAQYSLWVHEPLNEKDQVLYKGKRFEVEESQDWDQSSSSIRHLKYVMLRTKNQSYDRS
jgi:hypothetical protein